MSSNFIYVLFWAWCLTFVAATLSSHDLSVRTYNAPGETVADTYRHIGRGLAAAKRDKRDEAELKGNTTLDRSWDGAVLLKVGLSQAVPTTNENASASVSQSVEIICKTCYVKGIATAELNIPDDFNFADALNETMSNVQEEVANLTEAVSDQLVKSLQNVTENLGDGIDWDDFDVPSLNYTFDIDVPAIPECDLSFTFDGMELYLEMETILGLGATYELNLYTSNTPIGFGLGKDIMLGVVFKVDLLLSVDGTINISNGFHIKLDDGIAIDISLFGDKVSNLVMNGGQFEFLPVTVQSAGVVISAILRIGIHCGIKLEPPELPGPDVPSFTVFGHEFGFDPPKAGIEVGVFANIAEFITNVSYVPKDPECELKVEQSYQLALGAIAGASVAVQSETWGPVATASIPIWNTVLAEVCAIKATSTPSLAIPTITVSAGEEKRQALTTMTITTKITHTGVACSPTTTGNCPNANQITTKTIETRTLITAVPPGEEPTFPSSVSDAVTSTVPFGSNAQKITKTSGTPKSYTPPPPPPKPTPTTPQQGEKDNSGNEEATTNSTKKEKPTPMNKNLIIGLSAGLGIPILIAIVTGLILWRKRQRYVSLPEPLNHATLVTEPYRRGSIFDPHTPKAVEEEYERQNNFDPFRMPGKVGKGVVRVVEVGRAC